MPCTTQPQAKKKISRSTQKGGAQQDLVVHPRAPSHHQAHAVVLAPSATLGSTPELIDAEHPDGIVLLLMTGIQVLRLGIFYACTLVKLLNETRNQVSWTAIRA